MATKQGWTGHLSPQQAKKPPERRLVFWGQLVPEPTTHPTSWG